MATARGAGGGRGGVLKRCMYMGMFRPELALQTCPLNWHCMLPWSTWDQIFVMQLVLLGMGSLYIEC